MKKEICNESVQSQENINELTKNYTELQHDFEILHEKYIAQNGELKLFRNKTYECNSEITSLIQLKTTQPLQDFHTLQKEVQSKESKFPLELTLMMIILINEFRNCKILFILSSTGLLGNVCIQQQSIEVSKM
jgi:hypothetical protein